MGVNSPGSRSCSRSAGGAAARSAGSSDRAGGWDAGGRDVGAAARWAGSSSPSSSGIGGGWDAGATERWAGSGGGMAGAVCSRLRLAEAALASGWTSAASAAAARRRPVAAKTAKPKGEAAERRGMATARGAVEVWWARRRLLQGPATTFCRREPAPKRLDVRARPKLNWRLFVRTRLPGALARFGGGRGPVGPHRAADPIASVPKEAPEPTGPPPKPRPPNAPGGGTRW